MKFWILSGLAVSVLVQSTAFAVVADKFQCSIQLFEPGDISGPRAESTLAIIRVPQAKNKGWIDGVSASSSHASIDLQAPGIKVNYQLAYELFYSTSAGKAAQWSCFTGGYEILDGTATQTACFRTLIPHVPFDPTDYFSETPFSNTGTPLFRSQDLRVYESRIMGSDKWSKFRVQCQYLGTFE